MKFCAKNYRKRGLFVVLTAACILLHALLISVSAQSSPTAHVYQNDPRRSKAENEARREIHERRTRLREMDRLSNITDRYTTGIGKRKLTKAEQLLLIPTEEEFKRYSGLSIIPGVRFGKLVNSDCGNGDAENGSHPACLAQIPGGGASYSFLKGFNDHLLSSDVVLNNGALHVTGFLTTGIITQLEEIQFQGDRADMPVLATLKSFVPAKTESEFFDLEDRLKLGIEESGSQYSSSVELEPGNVFAVRSISYRSEISSGEFRKDSITLIKILEIAPDGDVLFAWRSAGTRNGPKLSLDK